MESKEQLNDDDDAKHIGYKNSSSSDDDDDNSLREHDDDFSAPSSQAIALREGYNQTYIIKSSSNNLHEVLFRCGNWCYNGRVDLGSSDIGLEDLQVVIPALQKQQGSLQFLCEYKKMPSSNFYYDAMSSLYDTYDFIGDELTSDEISNALQDAAEKSAWVDSDINYFELQTTKKNSSNCFKDIDIIASKSFVRELVLLVVYYQHSYYVVLQDGTGDQPLLDVRFPDLSDHLQGMQLQHYHDKSQNYEKLLLWQSISEDNESGDEKKKSHSPKKQVISIKTTDVSGSSYSQTFVIRKTHDGSDNTLREVLFRFGNWCYNGHVDLGPTLELRDIPVIIPLLRRQQSALTFMCEASKMPSTSLFAEPMAHLASRLSGPIQAQLSAAEESLVKLADTGVNVEGIGDISSWLTDESAEVYFELDTSPVPELNDVEVIASKLYVGTVVLILLYFNQKFYVIMADGSKEQPLLDTRFPDVSVPGSGFQVKNYKKDSTPEFPELRRLSLWRVGEFSKTNDELERIERQKQDSPEKRFEKQPQKKAEAKDEGKTFEKPVKKSSSAAAVAPLGKVALPHHIAPLKASGGGGALGKLKGLEPLGALGAAPWDKTGAPLGSIIGGNRK